MFRMTKKVEKELDVARICANCEFSVPLTDSDAVLCRKKGMVEETGGCRKFRYDLLKRKPPRPVSIQKEELPSLDFEEEVAEEETVVIPVPEPEEELPAGAPEPEEAEPEENEPESEPGN